MPKLPSLLIAIACVLSSLPARAEDRADEPPPPPETVPVLIHAGGGLVLLDELSCLRAACEGRIALGRHHVTVKREVDGQWWTELERDVEITGPTEIRIERPGFLRKMAVATTAIGGLLALSGLVFPIVVAKSKATVDPSTGQVSDTNAFRDLPKAVQVGWIATIGVGLTLALVGATSLMLTSGDSKVTSRRWALAPIASPASRDARSGSVFGLGFVTTF